MDTELIDNSILNVTHNDQDLVQLAGFHAYRKYEEEDEIHVNGKVFLVEDIKTDSSTGLDALVVRNITPLTDNGNENFSGELIVVYVGSQQIVGDWINTNINLIGDVDPAQLKAAVTYFEDMEEIFGEISSVTGNSLGGALANRVAVDHPNVNSVTLNPAMLPGGVFDPDKEYSNITNYHSEYDILRHVQEAIQYSDRVPGTSYQINHGLPISSAFGLNHTGYGGKDIDGNFTVEIGTEGDPGHGQIHVGADDHIVLSIWSGAPLHGGSSVPLNLNVSDMRVLADAIKNQVMERLTLSSDYIENAMNIVEDESEKFEKRITELQQNLNDLLNTYIADPLSKGAVGIGNAIKTVINGLISLLDFAEEKLLFLNGILNAAPAEFIESLLSIDVSVETIISPIRNMLTGVIDEVIT